MSDSSIQPTVKIGKGRSAATNYALALIALAAAVYLRYLLEPWMAGALPLVTLFGAVAAAAWVGGYGPAVVVTVVGYIACNYLFIEPRGGFALATVGDLIGALAYLFTSFLITSSSLKAVFAIGSQLIMRAPRYIRPLL